MAQSELREAMLLPLDMEARLLLLEREQRLLRPLRLLSLLDWLMVDPGLTLAGLKLQMNLITIKVVEGVVLVPEGPLPT